MLKVLHGDATGEMELSGSCSDLLALGRDLRRGSGEILLESVENPSPYSRALTRIKIRQVVGKVKIAVSRGEDALEIEGEEDYLSLLAQNVEGFALEADRDDHLHVDYFPGHDYLVETSGSVVVAFDG